MTASPASNNVGALPGIIPSLSSEPFYLLSIGCYSDRYRELIGAGESICESGSESVDSQHYERQNLDTERKDY